MQTDPAEIAAKLTKAQAAVLLAMSDGDHVYPATSTARDAGVPVKDARKIMAEFRRVGLAMHGMLWNEDDGHPAGSGTWLVNSGLAVRAHLLKDKSND